MNTHNQNEPKFESGYIGSGYIKNCEWLDDFTKDRDIDWGSNEGKHYLVTKDVVKFDINNFVRVKLTDMGKRILEKDSTRMVFDNRIIKKFEVKEDSDGWSEWQLWDLMATFGEYMHDGCKVPFETEVEIPTESLKYS